MYGCESWTIKKAECQRIDAFELWWWRRLLSVPWAARRSNQSNLKEIKTEYSLEGLMLKLQYFGHLMPRADSLEKTTVLGKNEGRRRRGWQRLRWLNSITDSMDVCLSKLQDTVKDRGALCTVVRGSQRAGCNLVAEQQQHWELLRFCILSYYSRFNKLSFGWGTGFLVVFQRVINWQSALYPGLLGAILVPVLAIW